MNSLLRSACFLLVLQFGVLVEADNRIVDDILFYHPELSSERPALEAFSPWTEGPAKARLNGFDLWEYTSSHKIGDVQITLSKIKLPGSGLSLFVEVRPVTGESDARVQQLQFLLNQIFEQTKRTILGDRSIDNSTLRGPTITHYLDGTLSFFWSISGLLDDTSQVLLTVTFAKLLVATLEETRLSRSWRPDSLQQDILNVGKTFVYFRATSAEFVEVNFGYSFVTQFEANNHSARQCSVLLGGYRDFFSIVKSKFNASPRLDSPFTIKVPKNTPNPVRWVKENFSEIIGSLKRSNNPLY